MNYISFLILGVLVALTHQSEDGLLQKKLIINKNESISAYTYKKEENILMYRINDNESFFILNKLNNKFTFRDPSEINLFYFRIKN